MNTRDGDSVLLAELMHRGVEGLDAKQHNDALDSLGINRSISCGVEYLRVSAVLLGNRLSEAIPLLGAYLLNPSLPSMDLPACKSLCLQSIQSIADNPSHLASIALNEHHLPTPFNRSSYGTAIAIGSATIEELRTEYQKLCIPNDAILVISGQLDHEQVVQDVESLIKEWSTGDTIKISTSPSKRGAHWIQQDTSQVHLAFAFDAPDACDANSILESVAISIFGGATSGRLFTQVRQRRSLCYSVSARYAASKERSVVRMHAGTTPERAEETVEVCLEQLAKLKNGVTKDEFDRTIQRMKSRTVMHGESTAARASAIWGDQYALGWARSLADRLQEIERVQFEAVNDWLVHRAYGALTFIAVGPEQINIDETALLL
jgi:predicted Zn-dependent peptidase